MLNLATAFNMCRPNPCLHNGVCQKTAEGFDCTCHGNYDGKTCQCKYFWYKFVYAMCFHLKVYGSLSRKLYN